MENVTWSHVAEPARGPYGSWELRNLDCVGLGVETSATTKLIQLLFATMCFCQVIFMSTRAPRVTWEAVFLPLVQTIMYSLSASGNGVYRMGDGKVFPFARMASWLVTCPLMLFQANGINKLKWKGVALKNMMMAASIVRTVTGMAATISPSQQMTWVFYGIGWCCLLFEFSTVWTIFAGGLKKFSEVKTPTNNLVHGRLLLMRGIFFPAWTAFPAIWLLSSSGLCLISEDAAAMAYLVADALCKNVYGLIQTNTVWGVLDGKWKPETLAEAGKPHEDHSTETWLNQAMMGIGQHHQHHDTHPEQAEGDKRQGSLNPRNPSTQFSKRQGGSDAQRRSTAASPQAPQRRGREEGGSGGSGSDKKGKPRAKRDTESGDESESGGGAGGGSRRERERRRAGSTSGRSRSSRRSPAAASRHGEERVSDRDLKRGSDSRRRIQEWREQHPHPAAPDFHISSAPPVPAPRSPSQSRRYDSLRRPAPGKRLASERPAARSQHVRGGEMEAVALASRVPLPEQQSDTSTSGQSWLRWLFRSKPAETVMPLTNHLSDGDDTEGSARAGGPWQDNSEAAACNKCKAPFSMLRRRHHCRNCGLVFCMVCSSKVCVLPHVDPVTPQRVCTDCFQSFDALPRSASDGSRGRRRSAQIPSAYAGRDRSPMERKGSR